MENGSGYFKVIIAPSNVVGKITIMPLSEHPEEYLSMAFSTSVVNDPPY